MNRLLKSSLFLSLATGLLLDPQSGWAGRKIAVIVDGGDQPGSHLIRESSAVLEQTYQAKARGFEVIRISAPRGAGIAEFHEALSKLTDVDEVEIALVAHGVIVPDNHPGAIGAEDKRIPKSHLRPDEVSQQLMETGAWAVKDSIYFGYAMESTQDGKPQTNYLGLGDLRRAILDIKSNNPRAPVTVSSLSCYGGNAIRALEDIPGTQVFASTSGSQYYWTVAQGPEETPEPIGLGGAFSPEKCGGRPECLGLLRSNSYLLYFHQALEGGSTYSEAHAIAKRKFQEGTLSLLDFLRRDMRKESDVRQLLVAPQSSFELALADECLGSPQKMAFEPLCTQAPSPPTQVSRLADQMGSLAVWDDARDGLLEQERHLARIANLVACEPATRTFEKETFGKAFQEVLDRARARIEQTSESSIGLETKALRDEMARIEAVRTPEELLPWKSELPTDPKSLSASKHWDLVLRSLKSKLLETRQGQLAKLSGPLSEIKKNRRAQIGQFEHHHFPSCLKGEADACHEGHLEYMSESLFTKPFKSLVKASEQLGTGECSIGRIFSESKTMKPGLKERQIDCILKKTRDDPELRVVALRRSMFGIYDPEMERACKSISETAALNQKLLACVTKPETAKNQALTEKLRRLLLLGGRTVPAPARR